MDADLDLLLTTVFVTADDLLPERQNNAARRVAAAITLNHQLGRPSRALVNYCAQPRREPRASFHASVLSRHNCRAVARGVAYLRHP